MNQQDKINYVEFPSADLAKTKRFFADAFGWEFQDYGPEYTAITNGGLDGGFFLSDKVVSSDKGSVLVVIYSKDLEATQQKVEAAGGRVIKPIFAFPGGRRFHFCDVTGNEYAVWSDMGL